MADGKVLWHTTMSLDGFIAGPDDAMDWTFGANLGPSEAGSAVVHTTGAILAGRRWYDLSLTRENWAPYGGTWHGPIFVLTQQPPAGLPEAGISFVSGDIRGVVADARRAAAGKAVVIFGATIARACIEAGVLDEILVHIVPVLLGDGVRFFDRPGTSERIHLRRTALAESGQMTDLHFTVTRGST